MQSHISAANLSIPAAQWDDVVANGMAYKHRWTPDAGVNGLRILVRDARTGEYGSLDVPVATALP